MVFTNYIQFSPAGALALLVAGFLGALFVKRYQEKYRVKNALALISEKYAFLDESLLQFNSYYAGLSGSLRQKFLQRTVEFMQSKRFIYHNLEEDQKIELLVSAAAIQVTFGLENYLFHYFKEIHILRTDYHFVTTNVPFMGHVNSTGIYLSLNNFLAGYKNYGDANNVGLHEMAHALAYVNFTVEGIDEDAAFKARFKDFSLVARPIFESMQSGQPTFLDNYAGTNYQEFWAVCIETFFERSAAFRANMPELYLSMCLLLKQDPLGMGV